MSKGKYVDNTSSGLWGYRPEPDKHDAFVGWRTIIERCDGKFRLDYVPGRGSVKGIETDCNRLVRWWSKGRDCPEKWWLKNCTRSIGPSVRYKTDENSIMTCIVERSDEYVYISLYLDREKK